MQQLKQFGEMPAEHFLRIAKFVFSPEIRLNEDEIIREVERIRPAPWFDSFVADFRHFLVDTSLSFEKKVEIYMYGCMDENEAYQFLHWCWQILAPGEPWPVSDGSQMPMVVTQPEKNKKG